MWVSKERKRLVKASMKSEMAGKSSAGVVTDI